MFEIEKMELGCGSEVEHLLSMHRARSTYSLAGRKQKGVCACLGMHTGQWPPPLRRMWHRWVLHAHVQALIAAEHIIMSLCMKTRKVTEPFG